MPRKKTTSVQLRVTVPTVAQERLERLADALATSVPDLLRFMVSTSLVQWETMYLHPEKYADAVNASRAALGPEVTGVLDELDQEALELVPDLAGNKKLGFGPRGELVALGAAPAPAWTGYMAGL